MQEPSTIVNRALDAIGKPELQLGSITDGTLAGRTSRRIYGTTLRELLRTSHWAFARKKAPLQLLGDATGQLVVPNGPAQNNLVEQPWRFAYAWPVDGVRARWLPWDGQTGESGIPPGNYTLPNIGQIPGQQQAGAWISWREAPAPFLVSTSSQYPFFEGQVDWPDLEAIDAVEGVGIQSRQVVLTNVPSAQLVYTMLATEIELWDSLFSQAMVSVLAERLAMALLTDKKEAIVIRNAQIAIAKDAIREARVASANEAGFPLSVSHTPDWLTARHGSYPGGRGWGDASPGVGGYLYCGWSGFAFGDGSVF